MNQATVGKRLFFAVAVLLLIVAFVPLVRGGRMNVVFFGCAVVFFILGAAAAKQAGKRHG